MRVVIGVLAVALAFAGCGGAGDVSTACTTGTGATRTCFELATNVVAPGGVAQAATDCMNGGGVASTTCPRAGADGGCRMTVVSGAVMESITLWFYAGKAAQEMADCANGNANGQTSTWISP
jgi:hypothetical protein